MAHAVASVSPTDVRWVPIGAALDCIENNDQAALTKPLSARRHELVLGHAIGGVREIYNRDVTALQCLVALVEIILAGRPTNDIDELRALIDSMVAAPTNYVVKLRSSAAAA